MKTNEFVGRKFGRLTVLEELKERVQGQALLRCECDCGNFITVRGGGLRSGTTKSCGCLKKDLHRKRVDDMFIDLTGLVFGDLTVIEYKNHGDWLCKCSCGNYTTHKTGALRAGEVKSCGCKRLGNLKKGAINHIAKDSVKGTRKTALTAKLHKGNKSGYKGVRWNEQRQKWTAHIGFQGKQINLGYFTNKDDAIAARKSGEEKYFAPILEENDEI